MKYLYYFIKFDFWIQVVLGISILCSIWFIVGFWLLAPFGAWQVLSAIFLGFAFRDWRRMYYLSGVATFFSYVYLLEYFKLTFPLTNLVGIISVIALAVGYFLLTKKDYKRFDHPAKLQQWQMDKSTESDL